jgi:hypothetical protein
MPETKEVTYKNTPATLTIQDDGSWTISGTSVNLSGKGAMSLMKLMDDRDLSLAVLKTDPTAAAAAAGRRKTRRRRHQRKTRRSRK